MTVKRDLLVFGSLLTVAGILWMVLAGWSYVTAIVAYNQICSGGGYNAVACQTAMAQTSLTSYWMFAGLAVFIVGLWGAARSFMTGEDLLAAKRSPARQVCPTCKTWQEGPFCGNDGTKL